MAIEGITTQAALLQNMAQLSNEAADIAPNPHSVNSAGFAEAMQSAIWHISDAQTQANGMMRAIETGDSDDLVGTMVASQKAGLGFSALVQVRNRVVKAFDSVMSMPI